MADEQATSGRREPPRFRRLALLAKERLGPRMIRVTLGGDELDGFVIEDPAASVRLLLPSPGSGELVMPVWNGNEFLMADGSRPTIRTFTPRNLTDVGLDLDIVIHDGGATSGWATTAVAGDPAAISGPGRGYDVDKSAAGFLLAGDETAIPAIAQLLETIPEAKRVEVHLEVRADFGRVDLPKRTHSTVVWHDLPNDAAIGSELLAAIRRADLLHDIPIWCAGEAAAMHGIRTYLFKELGVPRSQATVRGYWKRRDS